MKYKSFLGRFYLTTSKALDVIREQFTFSVNAISSYELGKPMHGVGSILEVPIQSQPGKSEAISEDSSESELDLMKVS